MGTLDRKMWVFKEHSLIGHKTPAETPSGWGVPVRVESFVRANLEDYSPTQG